MVSNMNNKLFNNNKNMNNKLQTPYGISASTN